MTPLKWPWFPDDGRERGWFIAEGNCTRYGPLPEVKRAVKPSVPASPPQPRLIDPWRESGRP